MPSAIVLTLTPDSKKIIGYGYDADSKRLAVQFKRFDNAPPAFTYEYLDVPADKVAELGAAESKGGYINKTFVYPKWAFEKIPN